MLAEYLATAGEVTPLNAWLHVYRLLLWIDPTTSLAHCYESDKAQPGRTWYARSLAFHDWLSTRFQTSPGRLGDQVDWLFRRGTELLASAMAQQIERRARLAQEQLAPYRERGMPEPGQDPALEHIVCEELASWLSPTPPAEALHRLARRLRNYLAQENKRKNLVGEGFEDVLACLIERLPGTAGLEIKTRTLLSELWGFRKPSHGEKEKKVDLAIRWPDGRRVLVGCKWSVRADREEQFAADFEAYARLDALGQDFGFVLVTNEFDAARLVAACERRRQNAVLFSSVVHVNPDGPQAAYGNKLRAAAARLPEEIRGGRLLSLEQWLATLITP